MTVLKIYVMGLGILVGAIALNGLAGVMGLATWYSFLQSSAQQGFGAAMLSLSLVEGVFLALLYPLALGGCGYGVLRAIHARPAASP